ncbi:sensor histidine kinase [Salinimonas iocasae]|uniref:histidine kinase n=1 Tax=Salinimonas iocasae TaxID=2572577 RepID=A0A5B7YDS0_9ALTE|nr:sensor histidine kinase [Salinimonas iocasae]QCZ93366.1 sensor histidine kinase [Salinimonas iocasae]
MKLTGKLESWLVASIALLSLLELAVLFIASQYTLASVIEDKTGQQALAIARSLASRPDITEAVENEYFPPELKKELSLLQHGYGASFVVVGNNDKKRLFHPIAEKVGMQMQGGDSDAALSGRYYVSRAEGSMGPSIRGKAPVLNEKDEVIGLVSVGYLDESVSLAIDKRSILILAIAIGILILAVLAALWIGRRVRSKLFGLQPDEIGRLYAEQKAIFNTVRTGIIALKTDGTVQRMNQRARNLLCPADAPPPKNLTDLFSQHTPFLLSSPHEHITGFELFANNQSLVLSRLPLQVEKQTAGLLISLRPADEVEQLSRQLARVEAFAELLRVQTHDYSNKLNTLAAMLQMGNTSKALELISNESQGVQTQVQQLLERVHTPTLAALLFGKYHKARECNISFRISPDTHLDGYEDRHFLECLVSIFGNLIDNAIEAVQRAKNTREPLVFVSLEELGNNIVFDVEDSGEGIEAVNNEHIFAPTFSSKKDARHGVGMYSVKTYLEACGGSIEIGESELGGARFSVYIPKPEIKS